MTDLKIHEQLAYCASLSIIAFDQLVMTQDKQAVLSLSELESNIQKVLQESIDIKDQRFVLSERLTVKRLSHQVSVVTKSNTNADCVAMLSFCAQLMASMISQHILLTGSIQYGRYVQESQYDERLSKAMVIADLDIKQNQWAGIVVDTIVKENLEEARLFTGDTQLFSKMGESLLTTWQVPVTGKVFNELAEKEQWVIDWPRCSLQLFEKIRQYTMDDFYYGYELAYGPYKDLDERESIIFENTLTFINHSLANTVKLYNLAM